jgi:hypothetical protein
MIIYGTNINRDVTVLKQEGVVDCEDNSDLVQSDSFIIGRTIIQSDGSTFVQGQLLDWNGLTLSLNGPRFIPIPGSFQDGTITVNFDGTYCESMPFNPLWINYGIYNKIDSSNWALQGYRFREPMNPRVGFYYANMLAPPEIGTHKIQWIYTKDSSSYATAVNQTFSVNAWGNGPPPPYNGPAYSQIEVIPAAQRKNLGETAAFSIIIHSPLPVPLTYMWRKQGINLIEGGKFSGTATSTLTITDVSVAEYDFYTCVVSNIIESTRGWLFVEP